MKKALLYIISCLCFFNEALAQLTAHAGANITICINNSVTLGAAPSATGGTPPYKFQWLPTTYLNSSIVPNPIAIGVTSDITYTLTVTDYDTTIVSSTKSINIDKIYTFGAGIDTGYCYGQMTGVFIGASNNNNAFHTYSWSPSSGLDNSSSVRPFASPSVTTVYTLTVSDGLCPNNVSMVTVTAFRPPYVSAGADTTIDEGNTITLIGTGGTTYWWQPEYNIKYISTAQPDAWPTTNTTYTLYSVDQHGCYASDDITVTVRGGELLFFYSAFTPNNDGDNDVFYIGNVEKYPDNNLKIYNRYGKMVFNATNYSNTWNGTYLGNELPTGTYFYIFNDGKEKQYKGNVTIMR